MDLILALKEKLNNKAIESLSGFLGESQESIQTAFDLAIPAFLDVIVKKSIANDEVNQLKTVLNDGGHTGQILNDLDSLFANIDKVQLLITIGGNIVNHFIPNKTVQIASIIADFSKIKKTSATSVLSLASPLVLGALGNSISNSSDKNGDLKKNLIEQKTYINTTLPPVLANLFPVVTEKEKKVSPTKNTKDTKKETKTKLAETSKTEEKSSKIYVWLSWIVLLGLLLGTLFYLKFIRKGDLSFSKPSVVEPIKKDTFDPSELLTPHEDSMEVNDFLKEPSSVTNRKDSIKRDLGTKTEEANWEEPKEAVNKTSQVAKLEPAKKLETPSKTVSPKNIDNTKKSGDSKPAITNKNNSKSESISTQKLPSINGEWLNYSSVNFARNSAEIRSEKAIKELYEFLKKNPNVKLKIAGYSSDSKILAEDRAYAIREALIEKGISESKLLLSELPLKGNGMVAIKAIK